MPLFYIDTCSLKWRYLNGAATNDVNNILEGVGNKVFTTELTLLEWSSAFAVAVRENHIDYSVFKSNELALFTDIAEERLKIFQPERVIERSRAWIEFVGTVGKALPIGKRALRTVDAIHVVSVLELSSNLGEPVEFITSDTKLFNILDLFDEFKPYVNANFLSPT